MLSLPDAAAIRAALHQPHPARLHAILADELATAETCELQDLTYILVIQPGDTEEAIKDEIGWSPLVNPVEGTRFGTADFLPYWVAIEDLGGWYELIHAVSNDGFAYILLIEDAPGVSTDLLRMCRQYAEEAGVCGF
jgi:hypothetical protein